jgi:hypothetical protein
VSWRRRLAELLAAGGALAGCSGTPCGNANPDPCICGRMPESTAQCTAENSCRGDGGVWNVFSDASSDAGTVRGVCYIPDAGPHD